MSDTASTILPVQDTWLLREDELPEYQHNVEDILYTLGNGIIGVAGVPALAPAGSQGMFAAGLYADGPGQMHWLPEPGHAARDNERYPTNDDIKDQSAKSLIACPRVFAAGMKWNGSQLESGSVTRTLDMRHGTLTCISSVDIPGGVITITDRRFVSQDDLHLLAQRLEITSTISGRLEFTLLIDASCKNHEQYDLWAERNVKADGKALVWHGIADGTGSELAIAQLVLAQGEPTLDTSSALSGATIHTLHLAANTPAIIDRFIGVGFTTYDKNPEKAALDAAAAAAKDGFDACEERQRAHWKGFWQDNDIIIDGPKQDQLAVRYGLFQLHSATPPEDGIISIGAKFLSGEWYRACVFWDTDVFIGPYFTRAQPRASRSHLLYRYRTLPEAQKDAKTWGCTGARYSLESMPPTGEDATKPWIIFGATEVHTSGGVAWAITDYFNWTGDTQFMKDYGAEILAETARFWISRFTRTERGLELKRICGPDEYHPIVDNNVYTNTMARENLRAAAKYSNASDEEKQSWLAAADEIFIHQPNENGVIEQCDGFFELPDWHRGMYVPKAVEYQLLKQADIIMLPLLMPDLYPKEIVKANYDYYEPHTVHESSLSAGAHAVVAARLGMMDEAYDKFRFAAYMQLEDRMDNTHQGLHAACIGMVPRIIMEGFAGLQIKDDKPVVSPQLPPAWKAVEFQFSFRGGRYRCHIEQDGKAEITAL